MKVETKDDIKPGALGIVLVALIVWSLLGCATPDYKDFKNVTYRYYVIDEYAEIPDAYFETKEEAESYKKYFEKHHTYKIVSVK